MIRNYWRRAIPPPDAGRRTPPLLAQRGRPIIVGHPPDFERPDSQLPSAAQILSARFEQWRAAFRWAGGLNRKLWEYLYILNAIDCYVGMGEGVRALGFGTGKERIPALLAARGCTVLATDYQEPEGDGQGWETRSLADLFHPELCHEKVFSERVSFRPVDMNAIPPDLTEYDCLWSCGSLEHIGGLRNGMDFVLRAMDCLRPGGIAVHTTEFNLCSNDLTFESPELAFYRRRDIEELAATLIAQGHQIVLNFTRGDSPADLHVDRAPFTYELSITALVCGHVITSLGLIIQKGG
ncbi:MAG: class I SAM-dependent methyltransferase [Rhodospirillales bacterium]|nr:class I SAM-dependent methyltransferase [Rhodospirillales bacterium]